jgi:hypothetical protein
MLDKQENCDTLGPYLEMDGYLFLMNTRRFALALLLGKLLAERSYLGLGEAGTCVV